jgi:hypothetical protein
MLRRTCALVSIAFALSLFAVTVAATTAQRTFVASTGNDANPCSIAAPCRGFARAITQTSVGGEVIVLDSAGYGPVTVTKSASIIAPAGIYAGISVFTGDGVTVNAPSAIVVLRGLSINGQGGNNGISLLAAARLRVENCVVSGMHVAGISHTAAASDVELIVLDTVVRDNLGSGVYLFADLGLLVLDHVRSEHNGGNGVSFTPGVGSPGAYATITDSVFTHNDGDGIGADAVSGATITLVVERSVMSSNGQNGFRAAASAGAGVATVSRSAINDNGGNGVSIEGIIEGFVSENVVHRNSADGVLVSSALPPFYLVTLSGNAFNGNLTGAIRVTGSGANVAVSANTTVQDLFECDNSATLWSFKNNSSINTSFFGCVVTTYGFQ